MFLEITVLAESHDSMNPLTSPDMRRCTPCISGCKLSSHLDSKFEGDIPDGAERRIQSSLCKVLSRNQVSKSLFNSGQTADVAVNTKKNVYNRSEKAASTLYMLLPHLCCRQEDFFSNMSQGASIDAQAHSGEDVCVVALTRVEGPSIRQGDGVKRTATGKDAPPLQHRVVQWSSFNSCCHYRWANKSFTAVFWSVAGSSEHLCDRVALLSSTFSFAGWVAQGKDDRAFIKGGHVPDNLLGEGSGNSRHTWSRSLLLCVSFYHTMLLWKFIIFRISLEWPSFHLTNTRQYLLIYQLWL